MKIPAARMSARDFHAKIADPDVFCGGGSVAAIAGAGAAATSLLVMRLNLRRKRNAVHFARIQHDIERTEAIEEACYLAADADIEILDRLLEAQRSLKRGGERSDYLDALAASARSPVEVAEIIARLLDHIESQLGISTRFTVSDLGAAAVLAAGACRAALLTAEVNIALLADAPDCDESIVASLDERRAAVFDQVRKRADDIEARVQRRVRGVEEGTS